MEKPPIKIKIPEAIPHKELFETIEFSSEKKGELLEAMRDIELKELSGEINPKQKLILVGVAIFILFLTIGDNFKEPRRGSENLRGKISRTIRGK